MRAIIIRKQNTSEYDQLVTSYTESHGKVVAIAKSVLKSSSIQAMHLDLFNLVEFDLIEGRSISIITGAQAQSVYPNVKSSLPHLAVAYFFAEVVNNLVMENQEDTLLWNSLIELFSDLDVVGEKELRSFYRQKQSEMLDILGYYPDLTVCSFCSLPVNENFLAVSSEAMGVVCKSCFMSGRKGIMMKKSDFDSGSFLDSLYESVREDRFHSLKFVRSVLK